MKDIWRMAGDGAGAGSGAAGATGGSAGNGGGATMPTTIEGWKTYHETEIARVSKERDDSVAAHSKLKKEVGTQGNELSTLRKMQERVDRDPKGFIQELAKTKKLDVSFGGAVLTRAEITKRLQSGDMTPEEADREYDRIDEARLNDRLTKEMAPYASQLVEAELQKRYPDFDQLAQTRKDLSAKLVAQEIAPEELYHLAAQGLNMKEAIEAAELRGYNTCAEQVQKKYGGQHADGGAAPKPDGNKEPAVKKPEEVVAALNKSR